MGALPTTTTRVFRRSQHGRPGQGSKPYSSAGTLTVSEQRVRHGALTGEPVDLVDGAVLDLDYVGAGTSEQNVRASWLADLLSGRTGDTLHPKGLNLRGALIIGSADWQARQLTVALVFRQCAFKEPLVLDQAQVVDLLFDDCRLPALNARQLQASYDISFDRSHIPGRTVLAEARVGGKITARAAELGQPTESPDTVCLDAEHLHVTDDLVFTGAIAHGKVRLAGAEIGGDVYLDDGCTATGEVRLAGAQIKKKLNCAGATFTNEDGRMALSFERTSIQQDVEMKPACLLGG